MEGNLFHALLLRSYPFGVRPSLCNKNSDAHNWTCYHGCQDVRHCCHGDGKLVPYCWIWQCCRKQYPLLEYMQYSKTSKVVESAQYSRLRHISSSFRYNGSLVTWTVVCLTAAKFKPLILSMSMPCPILWTILLYNRIHMEFWKPCVNRESIWALENCHWCGEPCFVGTVILLDGCLPRIPRRDLHKSLQI
jgi:hypothetical protein